MQGGLGGRRRCVGSLMRGEGRRGGARLELGEPFLWSSPAYHTDGDEPRGPGLKGFLNLYVE